MRDETTATGFVLRADPQGEYDKRLTLMTREYGKITAFARGARRPRSPLLASCNPFVLARFHLYEGSSAYTLVRTEVEDYFTEIGQLYPGVYYGFYFLELCGFYSQENLEAGEMVDLLYVTLRALLKEKIRPELIKSVFECRLMTVNGDFAVPEEGISDGAAYALRFASACPLSRLYSFELKGNTGADFMKITEKRMLAITGGRLKSLAVLSSVDEGEPDYYNQNPEGSNEES